MKTTRVMWMMAALLVAASLMWAGGIGSRTASNALGQSLSGVIGLNGQGPVAIHMPADWTAANLTFQACTSSAEASCTNYYDEFGGEVTVTAAAGRTIKVTPADFAGVQWLRIRSGTSGVPVAQAAGRTIVVAVRGF